LDPNALRAMDMIDKRFRDMYMNIAIGNLKPEKKHVMMEAMLMEQGLIEGEKWFRKGEWGAENFERTGAHRKDLLDIMTSFIPRDSVRFNKRVIGMKQGTVETPFGCTMLIFEDRSIVSHCAAIGCDGVKGFSRRVVLGDEYPELVDPLYTGRYAYRPTLPMQDVREILGDLATDAKMYMGTGANLSTYPISEGKKMNVVAFKRDPEPWKYPDFTYEVTREEMVADFVNCNPDPRLWAKPIHWGIFHPQHTPVYYNSLICLLSDVAHASVPHQGAGAGQCLEDALILSRVVGYLYSHSPQSVLTSQRDPSDRTRIWEAAFEAYDELRMSPSSASSCLYNQAVITFRPLCHI
ncbi:hypothetical protein K469DRAFT_602660, partial [Zopfia rhizophila CBS 207.26]